MRNTKAFDDYSRPRWQGWLTAHEPSIKPGWLARAIVDDEETEKDSQPRAMVYAWLGGHRTPSAALAWRTGRVLGANGYEDCGPASLLASGRFQAVVGVLGRLATSNVRAAVMLACGLLPGVEICIAGRIASVVRAEEVVRLAEKHSELRAEGMSVCMEAMSAGARLLPSELETKKYRGLEALPPRPHPALIAAYLEAGAPMHADQARDMAFAQLLEWTGLLPGGSAVLRKFRSLHQRYREWRSHFLIARAANDRCYTGRRAGLHRTRDKGGRRT